MQFFAFYLAKQIKYTIYKGNSTTIAIIPFQSLLSSYFLEIHLIEMSSVKLFALLVVGFGLGVSFKYKNTTKIHC